MPNNRTTNEVLRTLRTEYAALADELEQAETDGQPANELARRAAIALQEWTEANAVRKEK